MGALTQAPKCGRTMLLGQRSVVPDGQADFRTHPCNTRCRSCWKLCNWMVS